MMCSYGYEESWIAANFSIDLPTPQTHPDFSLWGLGFTPEQVYDAFFPRNFRFIDNPARPAICGAFGRRKEKLWRFEYVVNEGEDPRVMASATEANGIIMPYLTHSGHLYG